MMVRMSNAEPSGTIPQFTLGDRLRKAREVAGVSAERMGEVVGVTDRTIRNYESGQTPIKRGAVISWALATGVAFDWLWNGEDHGRTPPTAASRCTALSLVAA